MNILDKNKILNISRHGYEDLMKLENVNAVGLGYKYVNYRNTGELALHVLVEKKLDKSILNNRNLIPKNYMNVQTDVIEIGKVYSHALTSMVRPLMGGYSIGPTGYPWGGTLGCIVTKGTGLNKQYFILSNNHVLANGNLLPLGTSISQPASIDAVSNASTAIAMLTQYIKINFTTTPNTVDCAISQITNPSIITNKIALLGAPVGVANPKLNTTVQKVGRTTGLLKGKVRTIGATVQVDYGSGRIATFTNQILSDPISQPGDSGSLVLDAKMNAVGLLFAGSSSVTVFNNFNAVLSALNISLFL